MKANHEIVAGHITPAPKSTVTTVSGRRTTVDSNDNRMGNALYIRSYFSVHYLDKKSVVTPCVMYMTKLLV